MDKKVSITFKVVGDKMLVDTNTFSKLSLKERNLVMKQGVGKVVVFVDTFMSFYSSEAILNRMAQGKDITLDLNFHGITITDEEKSVIRGISNLMRRIKEEIKVNYPWETLTESDHRRIKDIKLNKTNIRRGEYSIGNKLAEKVWNRASRYWAGYTQNPPSFRSPVSGYYNKEIMVEQNSVKIGCQTITRAEVEYVARERGWALPTS